MRAIVFGLLLSLSVFSLAFCEIVFKECNQGLRDLDISALAVSPLNPNIAYIGSSKAVYRTENGGRSWETVLSLKGLEKRVNFLALNRKDANIIYAATNNGLLKIKSFNPNTWEKLFSGIGEDERKCLYVFADADKIFLGTKKGLFISFDSGKNWRKAAGELAYLEIISIAGLGERIFVAGADKLFFSPDSGKNFSRLFSSGARRGAVEEEESSSQITEEENLQEESPGISALFIDRDLSGKIYLASRSGLLVSSDKGATFSALASSGLGGVPIRNILSQDGDLYLATLKGVFVLAKDRQAWQNLYSGLLGRDVRFIDFDSLERLWAATNKGVFRSADSFDREEAGLDNLSDWQLRVKDEPSISEIQNAAIKYAEVIDPQKIRNLRTGARLRALIPDVDLDYDKTISSYSGGNFYIGPQDWNLGLSWDLGDLIWSDQQRLIDSQVRLMVELRDDILSEATRLYFERRRLQAELFLSPSDDTKIKLEKELRLQELTASIDALTGGYFSKELGMGK